MNRKVFIRKSFTAGIGLMINYQPWTDVYETPFIMTVNGKVNTKSLTITLPHEHITTDFTGAEIVVQPQYSQTDAINIILPWIKKVKQRGVSLLIECTPRYIGRDVRLLKLLSDKSGVHIMTNTGYYAAVSQKYLPKHAFDESANQLSVRFLKEWTEGIDQTGIRPGFIKLGVDKGPLKEVEKKLIKAGAITHLQSGLKIAIHTGDAAAAKEELSILTEGGVAPEAFIWVHAQNDQTGDTQVELAKRGCWISLDGINASDASIQRYSNFLLKLKENNLLDKVLISHDDGWAVNKNDDTRLVALNLFANGNTVPYQTIFTKLKPFLMQRGFTENDVSILMIKNPGTAYAIKICSI